MRRLIGRPLEELLAEVSPERRLDALVRLGAAVRALHDTPHDGLTFSVPNFDVFIDRNRREAAAIERARGADEAWVGQMDGFLGGTERGDRQRALLHTELGPGHVLARDDGARVELTGMIDFVDAMVGDPEYDFAAVAFFITRGDGAALGAFLNGYRWEGPRGVELARRLLRYLLLHRYAPLRWLLAKRPPQSATLDALAEEWMGIAG